MKISWIFFVKTEISARNMIVLQIEYAVLNMNVKYLDEKVG